MKIVVLILEWLHVLFAILAVGSNATYGFWLSRAAKHPQALPFTLRTIKLVDDRLANPSYGGLLVTGLLMAFLAPIKLTTPWLLSGIILYVFVLVIGILGYTPTLKKQIQAAEQDGFDSAAYRSLARRGMWLGVILAVLTITIVFLMVAKPGVWD
jgi:uncharacterized membrane protein